MQEHYQLLRDKFIEKANNWDTANAQGKAARKSSSPNQRASNQSWRSIHEPRC